MDGSTATSATAPAGLVMNEGRYASNGEPPPHKKSIAFFSQDISDVSTIKRVQQFLSRGFTVTVLGFRRDRYNADFKPTWSHVLLGYTQDRRYVQRILALLTAFPKLLAARSVLDRASILYARNLDQLVLALVVRTLINREATIVYEILDIQPIQAGRGLISAIVRWIERLGLRQVRYLVLSSAGFYRHYYAPIQGYKGAWLLLENKLPEPIQNAPRMKIVEAETRSETDRVWTIGYFGLIRGQETIDLIVRVAQRLGERVRFRFRGAFTTVDEAHFRSALAALPNISFGGRFSNPDDLAEIYGDVDFAWGIDLENIDNNSRWLLPCRLYEAGYFAVPCLAARGFELGNRVERQGIGWAFHAPFEDELVHFLSTLTTAEYEEKCQALRAMPDNAFVAGIDFDALSRLLVDPEWAFADCPRTGSVEHIA